MLDLKSIVCAGFGCIMHLQAMAEEVGNWSGVRNTFASFVMI